MEAEMATKPLTGGRLAFRVGLSGAVAAAALFTFLWSLAQLPMGPSDMMVDLFTTAGPTSVEALKEGVLYSALIGFFAGAFAALAYRAFEYLESR
jgi:hypothetical protein